LIGSVVKQGTSWTNFWGNASAGWYDAAKGAVTFKICSDRLFSLEKTTGRNQWSYAGLIINPTITIAGDRVYFVECRNAAVLQSDTRRIGMAELWQDQFLVALDLSSGKRVWEKPIDTADGTVVFYMAYGEGKLVVVASDNKYNVKLTGEGGHVWIDLLESSLMVATGDSVSFHITIVAEDNFNEDVVLSATSGNLPVQVTKTFSRTTVQPTGSTTLHVIAPSSAL
jgi:outer membrane protein assembly factor BamB